VLTLALGIGANAAIFSLMEAVLLRMLPVSDPRSLVIVRAMTRQGVRDWFSHKDYEWLRDHNQAFSGLAATANWKLILDSGDHKERTGAEFVSGNYFSMLGIEPAAGRVIEMEDERQSRTVAVISHAYWQRAFGGNADALGLELHLERGAFQIIGVAPAGFRGEYDGDPPDLWLPLTTQAVISRRSFLNTRNASWLGILGRLRPGLSVQAAQAEMRPLLESLRRDLHVDAQNDYLGSVGVEPGGAGLSNIRDYYGQPLRVLMGLVGVVLLIASANVANLLLARAAARRREFAVRLAIGASRLRLLRQLLTESFMLSGLACVAGLAIAGGIVRVLVATADVKGLDVHLNPTVLVFTIAITCASAVAFGMAPALQGNRIDPWTTLKEGRLSTGSMDRFKLSNVLVVAQTAFSVVLLIAAGLLLRTFWNLKSINPGFDQMVLEAHLDTSLVGENGIALGNRLVERLSSISGVQTASFSQFGFGQGSNRVCCIAPEGYTPDPDEDKNVRLQPVSPGYFRAQSISIVAGREFTAADRYSAPKVAVINETTARHYFHGVSPLGKRFSWWPTDPKNIEIVGVARDAKYDNLKEQTPRLVYVSILQEGPGPNFVQIRPWPGGRSADALIADCRAAIRGVNPNIRITTFAPISAAVRRTLGPELLVSSVSAGFGILALLLTSVGLYGVLAYTVARRTAEFGIRMALGAEARAILGMVMSEGLVLVAAGIAAGTLAAASLSHLLTKLLFGVPANDWATFVSAALTLLVVAAGASYWPARRATAVEPVTALRCE
jgi:predicted permease